MCIFVHIPKVYLGKASEIVLTYCFSHCELNVTTVTVLLCVASERSSVRVRSAFWQRVCHLLSTELIQKHHHNHHFGSKQIIWIESNKQLVKDDIIAAITAIIHRRHMKRKEQVEKGAAKHSKAEARRKQQHKL